MVAALLEGGATNHNEAVMSESPETTDPEEARESGRAFGKEIGQRTIEHMTRAGLMPDQLPVIGAEGVGDIIARAGTLASAGLAREIVEAWAEAAADAFHSELATAALLLTADLHPGAKH